MIDHYTILVPNARKRKLFLRAFKWVVASATWRFLPLQDKRSNLHDLFNTVTEVELADMDNDYATEMKVEENSKRAGRSRSPSTSRNVTPSRGRSVSQERNQTKQKLPRYLSPVRSPGPRKSIGFRLRDTSPRPYGRAWR
jgi:hypothetical protein